jgi:hypothetical protein
MNRLRLTGRINGSEILSYIVATIDIPTETGEHACSKLRRAKN